MDKTKLEMIFTDEINKTMKISIDNPRVDLGDLEIEEAMEDILTYNIFLSNDVDLTGKKGARFITTSIRDLEF